MDSVTFSNIVLVSKANGRIYICLKTQLNWKQKGFHQKQLADAL